MKEKLILGATLALLILQGCRKNDEPLREKATGAADINKSTGLKTNLAPGEYGTYQLISLETKKSAEVAAFNVKDGATSDVADFNNTAHQKFRITYVNNGDFKIMNLGSGKMAESYDDNGTQILVQNKANNTANQLWKLVKVSEKLYRAINKASGLAVTSNGTGTLTLKPYTGAVNQQWGYNRIPEAAYRDDAVVNFFHRRLPSQGSVAFDQGNSIPLKWGANNGKVIWVSQDAFDGSMLKSATNANLKCGFFQYNNSMLLQPSITDWNPDNTPNITNPNSAQGRPRQIIDNQPGTDWSWPGNGVEIGNKFYLYNGEGKGLGITNQSIFEVTETAGTVWAAKRLSPAGMSNQTETNFSAGMAKPGDGFVYAYGGRGVFFNTSELHVARFPENDPLNWTFWNGSAWTSTRVIGTLARVAVGQQNLVVSYLNGKYILMQLDLGFFCDPAQRNIYIATSSSPTGPFTAFKQVFTIEDRYMGHINQYYTPNIHPQFNNGKRELLVTYSVGFPNCLGNQNCVNNEQESTNYQVKGVRIPYSLIGL